MNETKETRHQTDNEPRRHAQNETVGSSPAHQCRDETMAAIMLGCTLVDCRSMKKSKARQAKEDVLDRIKHSISAYVNLDVIRKERFAQPAVELDCGKSSSSNSSLVPPNP